MGRDYNVVICGFRPPNRVASGFSRKDVAVANLWIASRILPAKAGPRLGSGRP